VLGGIRSVAENTAVQLIGTDLVTILSGFLKYNYGVLRVVRKEKLRIMKTTGSGDGK